MRKLLLILIVVWIDRLAVTPKSFIRSFIFWSDGLVEGATR